MNKEQYLATVHEQVQAYGYEPLNVPASSPVEEVYLHPDKGSRKWKYVVAVMEIDEAGVGQVREASEKAREAVKSHVEVEISFWKKSERVLCYLLLVPPSVTDQMEIYVEEGHKTIDADGINRAESWLYPVLVDFDNERLVYRESSGLRKLYLKKALHEQVEELFQI